MLLTLSFFSILTLNLQINAGPDTYFTFDYVFGPESKQIDIYDGCVSDLVNGKLHCSLQ